MGIGEPAMAQSAEAKAEAKATADAAEAQAAEAKAEAEAREAAVIMRIVDNAIVIPAGLSFTIASRGGVILDTGWSFPNEKGERLNLGTLMWRVMGTMQVGSLKQMIGIHLRRENNDGTPKPTPVPGQIVVLAEDTKFYKTSSSRWELYHGDEHPDVKYNIDPDTRNPHWKAAPVLETSGGIWND